MEAKEYLRFISEEIHTVIAATVDEMGLPVTAAIDMMDADENGLYFLTAKGKAFYERLIKREYLSLTGVKGKDTLSSIAVTVRGKVRCLGHEPIEALIDKNPYMRQIYPSAQSRIALSAFQLYEGNGEWFDLTQTPPKRAEFVFGGAQKRQCGYWITEKCSQCALCLTQCPSQCIDLSVWPAEIDQSRCLRCGNCFTLCPLEAVIKINA